LRGKIYLKESDLVAAATLGERYQTFSLFNSQGALIYTGKASDIRYGLTLPDVPPGAYYIILEGKDEKRQFTVVVGQ
jgi:hypothetical protein